MALFEKKQEVNQVGAKENLKATPPSAAEKKPPDKETEPAPLPPFKGKEYFPTKEFNRWLRSPEAWKSTKIPEKRRLELGPKVFNEKTFGTLIDKREPEKVKKELEKKQYGKFKDLTKKERKDLLKLYKGFFENK